jgi:hypothetical protein
VVEQLSTIKETPRACINGFKESTDSIRLSLMISEYEWPFFLNISIWKEAIDIRQQKSKKQYSTNYYELLSPVSPVPQGET